MNNKKKSLNIFSTYLIAAVIFAVLLIGSVWYLLNYTNQVAEKEKIEIAEYRLNELNSIYINFLKAVKENRGYRLYAGEKRKQNYWLLRDSTLSLISKYKTSKAYAKDSIAFVEVNQLIQKRIVELDEQLKDKSANKYKVPSKVEIRRIDLQSAQLEEKHAALLAFWNKQSKEASSSFDDQINGKDQLFFLWILFSIFLGILLVTTLRKKINSQFLQKFTEETLALSRQKEQEFSAAFDYAFIGMALVSTEGAWLRVNKSLCKLLGYTEEELLQQKFQDITHADDLNTDWEYVEQMLRNEIDTYQMEKRYYTKNGQLVWVLLSVSLVWENEQPKYFISQINDISVQKHLLEGIQYEKFRLQQVIDGTDAGTWEWNVQTGETIYNEKWAQIIGYTLDELDPVSIDTWMKYAHPEDLAASNQNLQDCFERRAEQYECACRMKHKSGEWVWVMDRGKVMSWTEDGKPEWMFGSHINITSMKLLEESLELERKKFSTIFNSTFQFIGFLDLEGIVLDANDTALDFAGLKPSDVIGKNFWDCHWWQINKETQEQLKEAIQKAAKGEEVSYEVAVWDINKTPKTILFHLQPIKDQYGNVAFIIPEGTLIQDLIDYRTKLEDKNQELEGFAAIAAHDLKEPLRMISQFMQKLGTKYEAQLDETAQKYIHFAADGAKRMNSLIDDLLGYAEIGGAKEEAFEMVDMNDVFHEILLLKATLIDEKNALVSKTNLPVVLAHKTAMRLLFQNLIGNGLKYQLEGNRPIIEIDFSETNNSFTFSFKDNGIGISEENYNKVFNLFSRLHTNSEYLGTGMGLATCKKIVASHRGEIWIESKQGEESTFYFSLPKT